MSNSSESHVSCVSTYQVLMPKVMKAKYELLNQDSLLAYEFDTEDFANVGGMQNLKQWLKVRKSVFVELDGDHGLPSPKGILLLGVQGCGKSLVSRAVAGIFSVPLLRLDFGSLYNKFFGESEKICIRHYLPQL